MILILGLSPAIDITYQLDVLKLGQNNRVKAVSRKAGGKSINVASVAKTLGAQTHLVVPLGGINGRWISTELAEAKLPFTQIVIQNNTRLAVTIFDGQATVINEPATELSAGELAEIAEVSAAQFASTSVFAISGSIPAGVPAKFLVGLIEQANEKSIRTIVDVSGPNLLSICAARPFAMKPNQDELREATGLTDLNEAVLKLQSLGARNLLVSMGSEGATWFDESGDHVSVMAVPNISGNPTGAGDAMVAALCVGLEAGLSIKQILTSAVAAGAAAVRSSVAGSININEYEEFYKRVGAN